MAQAARARRKKEEGRRKKEEGRRKKEEEQTGQLNTNSSADLCQQAREFWAGRCSVKEGRVDSPRVRVETPVCLCRNIAQHVLYPCRCVDGGDRHGRSHGRAQRLHE